MLALLLSRMSDVNRVDAYGRSPLWYAAEAGHSRAVALLQWYGAEAALGQLEVGIGPTLESTLRMHDLQAQCVTRYGLCTGGALASVPTVAVEASPREALAVPSETAMVLPPQPALLPSAETAVPI